MLFAPTADIYRLLQKLFCDFKMKMKKKYSSIYCIYSYSAAELREDDQGYVPMMQDDKHLFLTLKAARTPVVTAMALTSEAQHFLSEHLRPRERLHLLVC